MKNLVKEFKQLDGEKVLAHIEGNAWNDSPNPIATLISAIMRIFFAILGVQLRTYVIATNLRIVRIDKKTILWGMLPGAIDVVTLNKSSIQSVGYAMASSWFIFRRYYFLLANASGVLRLTYKGDNEDLIEACNVIDSVVAQSAR